MLLDANVKLIHTAQLKFLTFFKKCPTLILNQAVDLVFSDPPLEGVIEVLANETENSVNENGNDDLSKESFRFSDDSDSSNSRILIELMQAKNRDLFQLFVQTSCNAK